MEAYPTLIYFEAILGNYSLRTKRRKKIVERLVPPL